MLHHIRTVALALAAVIMGLCAPVAAQNEVENPPDPYVHKVVGVAFPAVLGGFTRGRVVEFDESGSDASVGYSPDGMPGEISLYVYPLSGSTCRDQFDGANGPILNRGGTVKEEDAGLSMAGFDGMTQYSRSYTIEPGGYGFDHPELASFLWVGCRPGSDWVVKYRGSFFASDADRIGNIANRLFAQIDWSSLTGGGKTKVK